MIRRSLPLSLLALLVLAPTAHAQNPWGSVGAGASFELYHFNSPDQVDLKTLSLLTLPFQAQANLSRQLTLAVSGAFANGRLERADGTTSTVSGLTDTQVRMTLGLGRDLVTITGIALLPTGKSKLTLDEVDVAGAIAADVFPFAISNWGSGGGFGLSTAVAYPLGSGFAGGLSVGYVVAREFEPIQDNQFSYRPGNQLHVQAAIDRTFGSAGKVALQLSMQKFQDDQLDGANLYQAGDRWQATGSYAFAAGARSSGIAYVGYLRRQHGTYIDENRIAPAQNLAFAGIGLRVPAGTGVLEPRVNIRVLNTDGDSKGYTTGIGASGDWTVGAVSLRPSALARFGSVTVNAGQKSGFTGFDLGMGLRFGGH